MKSFKTSQPIRAREKKLGHVQLLPEKWVHLPTREVTNAYVYVKTSKTEKEKRHLLDTFCAQACSC